jgi:hypothetical protein
MREKCMHMGLQEIWRTKTKAEREPLKRDDEDGHVQLPTLVVHRQCLGSKNLSSHVSF